MRHNVHEGHQNDLSRHRLANEGRWFYVIQQLLTFGKMRFMLKNMFFRTPEVSLAHADYADYADSFSVHGSIILRVPARK